MQQYAVVFYYVYTLYNRKHDFIYVGFTLDLRKEVQDHNEGKSELTASNRPLTLIHYEAYRSEKDAAKREKYLNTTKGLINLRSMLKESLVEIQIEQEVRPENAKTCPICGGEGEVWKSSQFYSGYTSMGMCMTCRGKGWIV